MMGKVTAGLKSYTRTLEMDMTAVPSGSQPPSDTAVKIATDPVTGDDIYVDNISLGWIAQ